MTDRHTQRLRQLTQMPRYIALSVFSHISKTSSNRLPSERAGSRSLIKKSNSYKRVRERTPRHLCIGDVMSRRARGTSSDAAIALSRSLAQNVDFWASSARSRFASRKECRFDIRTLVPLFGVALSNRWNFQIFGDSVCGEVMIVIFWCFEKLLVKLF